MAAIISFALPQFVQAQTSYKMFPGKDATIKVSGESNIHDWTMSSSTMESRGDFKFDEKTILWLWKKRVALIPEIRFPAG